MSKFPRCRAKWRINLYYSVVRSTLLFFFYPGGPPGKNSRIYEYSCMDLPFHRIWRKICYYTSPVKNYRFKLSKILCRNDSNRWSWCQNVRPRRRNVEILSIPENEFFMISGCLRRSSGIFVDIFGAQLRKANEYFHMVRSTLLFFFSSGGPPGMNFRNYGYLGKCMHFH